MSSAKDGGPAFPSPGVVVPGLDPNARQQGAYEGMTLRHYHAAHAPPLPRFVQDSFVKAGKRGDEMDLRAHADVCATWARIYADTLLRELAK